MDATKSQGPTMYYSKILGDTQILFGQDQEYVVQALKPDRVIWQKKIPIFKDFA